MTPFDEVAGALAGERRPFSDELLSMVVAHEQMMATFERNGRSPRAPAPVVDLAAWRASRGKR